MADNRLPKDGAGESVQLYTPNPSLSQVPATIEAAATKSDLNINSPNRWLAVEFRASGTVQVYFNEESTKYKTYSANEDIMFGLHAEVNTIHFKNPGGSAITLEVFGM